MAQGGWHKTWLTATSFSAEGQRGRGVQEEEQAEKIRFRQNGTFHATLKKFLLLLHTMLLEVAKLVPDKRLELFLDDHNNLVFNSGPGTTDKSQLDDLFRIFWKY